MVSDKENALELVYSAISELNEELEYESLAEPMESTVIYGGCDGIDSLSLVSLLTDLERRLKDLYGKKIALADVAAMSEGASPYASAGSLAEFIVGRIESGS